MGVADDGVTPAVLLQHMQGMERRLTERIDGVEQKVDRLEIKVDRHHAQTMVAFDNIDERLDDLEVVQVPKLKKVVGIR